jgi:dTDP-glucose 4,6-dehydratase
MILVTGGAGFIGGNYLHYLYKENVHRKVVLVDKLTYASNLEYIQPLIDKKFVIFHEEDIGNKKGITELFNFYKPHFIVNFAAESHVDNSIENFKPFVDTNISGTINLLECSRSLKNLKKFIHISTDEVYGSLELDSKDKFTENTKYSPNSPYSASKAASDHFVNAWRVTYGVPTIITNCSNNYGPSQHIEKFIPKVIAHALENIAIPVYGTGDNVRDWLYVQDHCRAINLVLKDGKVGETYNIGGGVELSNLELVKKILKMMDKPETLIKFVDDRLGHDKRYAIDYAKIEKELKYEPLFSLEEGLLKTIEWIKNGNTKT